MSAGHDPGCTAENPCCEDLGPYNLATIFDAIERNQELWRKTRSQRRRYRLCLENDELFKLIGIEFEPMAEPRGIYGWWLRRSPLLRIRGGQARPEA